MAKGLYIHIPFCRKKCAYCDFVSQASWTRELLENYVDALLTDLKTSFLSWDEYTIYIGGGTPSILPLDLLEKILNTLSGLIPRPKEFTFEANPESLDEEKLELLVQGGVTRLSLGVQSFHDPLLATLGRIHTGKEAQRKAEMVKEHLDNLNLDLIFAIPGQTPKALERDLEMALSLDPRHISAYSLTLEGATPMAVRVEKGELTLPEEEEWLEMFCMIPEKLASRGLRRYEISNFSLPGKECLHNLIYWENGEYLGVGASAVSHMGGERIFREKDPLSYIRKIQEGTPPICEKETLSPWRKVLETAMVGLRTTRGIDPDETEERWEVKKGRLKTVLQDLEAQGLLERVEGRWRIPERFLPIANEIMTRVLKQRKD